MHQSIICVLLFTLTIYMVKAFDDDFDTKARFDNYRVYSLSVENKNQLEELREIENNPDGLLYLHEPFLGGKAELLVPPHKVADVHDLFKSLKLKVDLKTRNIQEFIDSEQTRSYRAGYDWTRYYTYSEIYEWLDEILKEHSSVLKNYVIGNSYQGRPIRAVKLSHKAGNPTIFIESLIHAREWITAPTTTYLLNELLTSSDSDIVELAKNFDWVFVPIVNIDGYAYTHQYNRLWRKTRQQHSYMCYGADPNRNFDASFAGPGTSRNPCSEIYCGPKAFSEPETKALSDFISKFDNIKLYLAFHAYGQYILYPPGHTRQPSWNHNQLTSIASKTKDALKQRFGTDYVFGHVANVMYEATGSSADWAFYKRNISLSYTFELRDHRNGYYGFILPPDQIIPNCLEVMDGLKTMIKEAKNLKYF